MEILLDHSTKPLVSIVIPTSGTSPALLKCLRSCNRLRDKESVEVILVFDLNASHHTVENIKKEFPHYRLFFSDSPGATVARNLGIKNISGHYFLLIDDDCIVGDHDWLHSLITRASNSQDLNGGAYRINAFSSYWAKVYNWVNLCWLHFGRHPEGYQEHLLGGFLFGPAAISSRMVFNARMPWGGEEKELLQRLRTNFCIQAQLHHDLYIEHFDQTGLRRLILRAFHQGRAAGMYDLHSSRFQKIPPLAGGLVPGLIIFYCFSRTGILFGKIMKIKMRGASEAIAQKEVAFDPGGSV